MLKELMGESDYPGVGIVRDEDIYKLIMEHSTEEDRKDPRKMVEMTQIGELILFKIIKDIDPTDDTWMFYGEKQPEALADEMSEEDMEEADIKGYIRYEKHKSETNDLNSREIIMNLLKKYIPKDDEYDEDVYNDMMEDLISAAWILNEMLTCGITKEEFEKINEHIANMLYELYNK